MLGKTKVMPYGQFLSMLRQTGLTDKNTTYVNVWLNFLSVNFEGKVIKRADAETVLNLARKLGPKNFVSIIVNQGPSLSVQKYAKFYGENNRYAALKANLMFVNKNFSELFSKIARKKINGFGFEIGVSFEKDFAYAFNLVDGKEHEIARLNFDLDITRGRPVLVIGNFQGGTQSKEKMRALEKILKNQSPIKKRIHVFNFMLKTIISFAPQKIKIQAKSPETLAFMRINKRVIATKLSLDGRQITEESIEAEAQRIKERALEMHKQAFKKTGFKAERKKSTLSVPRPKRTRKV